MTHAMPDFPTPAVDGCQQIMASKNQWQPHVDRNTTEWMEAHPATSRIVSGSETIQPCQKEFRALSWNDPRQGAAILGVVLDPGLAKIESVHDTHTDRLIYLS